MERVSFLVEETGERISALLNPESIRVRRRSGLRTLEDRPGSITGVGGSDDPVIATSGGRTELELDLVFDVDLVGSDLAPGDVRDLTRPLWNLAENRARGGGPPAFRLFMGKAWNVPAVVEAISERLERFDEAGLPRRSWLRMRLLRTGEPEVIANPVAAAALPASPAQTTPRAPLPDVPGAIYHEVIGGGQDDQGERLDELAARYLKNPGYWRHLAAVNDIADPPWVEPGRVLMVPTPELLQSIAGPSQDPAGGPVTSP